MIHWHVGSDRLDIYKNGELVAQIPAEYYIVLLQALASELVDQLPPAPPRSRNSVNDPPPL